MNDPARIALVTTTINVPRVLELYREHDPDIMIFVAGDEKTPHDEVRALFTGLRHPMTYYSPDDQRALGHKCSDLIGWNTIARRNIATLEALKWGADIIVTIDDDNIPLNSSYFVDFQQALTTPFNGLRVSSNSGWFDVGTLLQPEAGHRGFPHIKSSSPFISHSTNVKVGVAAGICLGDPDISAVTRIARAPTVHQTSRILDAGIVVDPATWTVANSQNTAFIRELVPCFLMVPQFQRFDDILASLVAQRVMQERGLHVHFGCPMVWQQRNNHNLLKDLSAELWGEIHILDFVDTLMQSKIQGMNVVESVNQLYHDLWAGGLLEDSSWELVQAWLSDAEPML